MQRRIWLTKVQRKKWRRHCLVYIGDPCPLLRQSNFASSEGALGLDAAATALSSSLYTVNGGQRAVIFDPDLLSTHFSLHSLSLDEPRFAVFGFRSELLTCFCIHVCEIFIVICLIVECEFIVVWLWSGLNRMCETVRFFFFFFN